LSDFFARRLGHDFADVRIHADEAANLICSDLDAEAFAKGKDLFFAAGRYEPSTPAGLELLAHELVHVVQQGAAPRCARSEIGIRKRVPVSIQRSIDPSRLYRAICPDPSAARSHKSSSIIGTAFGRWLGVQYMREMGEQGRPRTYGIVDFDVYSASGGWEPGNIYHLHELDLQVGNAFVLGEWLWSPRQRPDILDADTSEVYEIKPLRSRDEGPAQLAWYLELLNTLAPTTSLKFGPERPRTWTGGGWDPRRYPLILPGPGGKVCIIYAWQDPQVRGLLVYDIVCCPAPAEQPADQPALRRPRLAEVVKEVESFKPAFEALVRHAMPWGESGASYAILTSTRFFELFVKGAWEREQDRLLQRYGPRPGPVFSKLVLESTILASVLGGPLADIIIAYSGYLPKEQSDRFLDLAAAKFVAAVVVGVVAVALPETLAAGAVSAPWVTSLGVTPAAAAEMTAGTALAGRLLPTVIGQAPRATSALLNGSGALLQAGRAAVPWALNAGSSEAARSVGLGVLGALVYLALPAEAQGAPAGSPETVTELVGSELPLLAPVEILVPIGGKVKAGSFVLLGDEKYFVAGLVKADVGT
jgi:hypothetical protein